jgi:membrane-associated protease RseP (regulator of RpoE activity)
MNWSVFSGPCTFLWLGFVALTGSLVSGSETPQLTELFGKLAADDFSVRRGAQEELVEWGKEDLEDRLKFFQEKQELEEDPEVRERCRAIVKELAMVLLDNSRPGFIGIVMGGIGLGPGGKVDVPEGVQVAEVRKGTPAAEFGLKPGDLILKLDETVVSGFDATQKLQAYVGSKLAGDQVKIHVERNGESLVIPLTLMKRPRELDRRLQIPFNGRLSPSLTEEELREREFQKWLRESKKRTKSSR